jgi:transposase-like protein
LQAPRRFPEGGIATGVNADGKLEILGFDVTSAEDGHGRRPA